MITSEKTTSLVLSLIKAKKMIVSGVAKNAQNPSFGSKYADLSCILEAVEEPLGFNGLVILQAPGSYEGGCISLTTRILHESGEFMEVKSSIPLEFADPQGVGSGITYLRRYALASLLGLYQVDDDANLATPRRVPVVKAKEQAPVQASKPAPQTSVAKPTSQPAATSGKVESWLKTISNASIERLQTAVKTAESTFQGGELETIRAAFAARFEELGVTA